MADTFAFIIHPIQIQKDVARKFPLLGKILTERQINFFSRFFPPLYISEVEGARSEATRRDLKGWLIAVPYTPPTMLALPVNTVYNKIVACGHMAERLGARILGLGAFTSVVGDAGVTIAERLDIPVTTGDSYTAVMAVEAIQKAAQGMGLDAGTATVAVIGATGAIGKACAQLLARECGRLILVGRRDEATEQVREVCEGHRAEVSAGVDVVAVAEADLILAMTSAIHAVVQPDTVKPGAVLCDIARPRDVSRLVAEQRDDVLVIDGGMVDVPGPVDFHFDFGFPPGKAYACMAETMALALEGRYEDYTLGREISIAQALEIQEIATRHGFRLSPLRSFGQPVTEEQFARVREKAQRQRKVWAPPG